MKVNFYMSCSQYSNETPKLVVIKEPIVVIAIIFAANAALCPIDRAITYLAAAVGAADIKNTKPRDSPVYPHK